MVGETVFLLIVAVCGGSRLFRSGLRHGSPDYLVRPTSRRVERDEYSCAIEEKNTFSANGGYIGTSGSMSMPMDGEKEPRVVAGKRGRGRAEGGDGVQQIAV